MSKTSSKSYGCFGLIGGIFIVLWLCYLCYIFTSYIWLVSRSATIDCKKIKQEYVSCQLTRNYLLGLWTDKISELQLLGNDVEIIDTDGGEFRTLYLKTNKGRIKFHQYGLNEDPDAKELDILLHDTSKSSVQISRAWNPLLDPLCIILSPLLFVGFLIALYSACNSFIKYLANQIIRLR
ncbi:hypothetical protein [Nostoc sp. TCL26-01]|uniref:hypothetical protein n=1 Tax=Nostoc sp. TCL26-01 TaxID=2576904 RepID=UPI0015BF4CEB|nr:hypothetical protein [Nostoc sp. TCL26-01]QLE55173.1 hypothetical protein FD725_06405 [Nostoc sp. TCL26-01]